jgi:hypothetical protein
MAAGTINQIHGSGERSQVKILLSGIARSGTSWAAHVLGRAPDTHLVQEPDSRASDILGRVIMQRLSEYPALRPADRPRWYPTVWDLAFAGGWPWSQVEPARAAGRQLVKVPPTIRDYLVIGLAGSLARVRRPPQNVVVKSVHAMMTLEWLADRYGPRVVIMRRNPLNVVSSWMEHDFTVPNPPSYEDPVVLERYITPLGLALPGPNASRLTQTAWHVGLWTVALKTAADQNPDWIVESHDAFCVEPAASFHLLFKKLGLTWTSAAEEYLDEADRPGYNGVRAVRVTKDQPDQWRRRLGRSEADEIRAVLADFPLGEWAVPHD